MISTILITSFNKGPFLQDCLDSIRDIAEQKQVLVFDNYSDDNTLEILKKNSDFCDFYQKRRESISPQINQINLIKSSVKFIKGDIIHLLDADDLFDKNKLKIISGYFIKKNIDAVFDIPNCLINGKINKFTLKKKYNNYVWPTIIPTSSISIRKTFLQKIIDDNFLEDFPSLFIDFRINVLARMFDTKYLIVNDNLNIYRITKTGIWSNYRKFNKNWWKHRAQAHNFVKNIFELKKLKFKKSTDFYLTNFINKFI